MAVGEAAVCLGVDLFAGTKVDESIKVSRAAAGTARVERCVENSQGADALKMDFEAFAVGMAVKTAVWPADSEALSCCRRKAVCMDGSSMLSTRFVALASKGL